MGGVQRTRRPCTRRYLAEPLDESDLPTFISAERVAVAPQRGASHTLTEICTPPSRTSRAVFKVRDSVVGCMHMTDVNMLAVLLTRREK